ncbi:MAG: hypothetical protein WCX46_03915 [Candidatus Paceibacterota bacterium]
MKKFIKENWFKLGILTLCLLFGVIFLLFFSSSNLKKDALCAGFKEQATDRIRTWYADGDVNNLYPNEIFYSKKKNRCIVLWRSLERNPADNGYSDTKVIFDPITNEDIYSHTFYNFDDKKLNEGNLETDLNSKLYYEELLRNIKN